MSGCTRCGDCCDPVILRGPADDLVGGYLAQTTDRQPEGAAFIRAHWTRIGDAVGGGGEYACTAFDRETRLCTAHDDRPPVCQGYPFYTEGPTPERVESLAKSYPACGYLVDLPMPTVRA